MSRHDKSLAVAGPLHALINIDRSGHLHWFGSGCTCWIRLCTSSKNDDLQVHTDGTVLSYGLPANEHRNIHGQLLEGSDPTSCSHIFGSIAGYRYRVISESRGRYNNT